MVQRWQVIRSRIDILGNWVRLIQLMAMEHIWAFRCLELCFIINVIRIGLMSYSRIKLTELMSLSLHVRLLITLRNGLLKTRAWTRCCHHTLCSAFGLMKKALLQTILGFFATTHAVRLALVVAKLCLQSVYLRGSLRYILPYPSDASFFFNILMCTFIFSSKVLLWVTCRGITK